jgi:hypothetical protein
VLAAGVGRLDAEVPLRALLRRRDPAGTLMPELAALLGLPDAVPAVLAGRAEVAALPGARWREAASVWAIASEQTRRSAENQSSVVRWAWFLLAALGAVSGAVLTVIELVKMAASGADAGAGAGHGDPLAALRFAGFTALMTWYAVRRRRRLRRPSG